MTPPTDGKKLDGHSTKSMEPVSLQRGFAMSAETLFDAWLDPTTMQQWMLGGAEATSRRVTCEARVGGRFSVLDLLNGEASDHFGQYRVVERPTRLVFTLR